MALDHGRLRHVADSCKSVTSPHQRFMARGVWLSEARCSTVRIRACRSYDRTNRILVPNGVDKPLDVNRDYTFTAGVSVSRLVERLAASVGRKDSLFRHGHCHSWVQDQVRASDNGRLALASLDGKTRFMESSKRRRACRAYHDSARD